MDKFSKDKIQIELQIWKSLDVVKNLRYHYYYSDSEKKHKKHKSRYEDCNLDGDGGWYSMKRKIEREWKSTRGRISRRYAGNSFFILDITITSSVTSCCKVRALWPFSLNVPLKPNKRRYKITVKITAAATRSREFILIATISLASISFARF